MILLFLLLAILMPHTALLLILAAAFIMLKAPLRTRQTWITAISSSYLPYTHILLIWAIEYFATYDAIMPAERATFIFAALLLAAVSIFDNIGWWLLIIRRLRKAAIIIFPGWHIIYGCISWRHSFTPVMQAALTFRASAHARAAKGWRCLFDTNISF